MTSLEREKQLCEALARLTAERGYSPTLRELAPVLEVSLTRIAQVVASCQRKGLVASTPGICRTLRVVGPREQEVANV
jgi:hypothetical protein